MMTQAEKVVKLLELYGEASKLAAEAGNYTERALWHMLTRWKDELPEIVPGDWFHKAFRQVDVLGSGEEDMVVWCLLYDVTIFWDIYEKVAEM